MGQAHRGQRSWTDLGLLLLCEVIFDVEGLPDLLGGLPFDHVGHRLTGDVQQAFNVQVIGRLKEEAKEAVLKFAGFFFFFCIFSSRVLSPDAEAATACHVRSSIRRPSGQSDSGFASWKPTARPVSVASSLLYFCLCSGACLHSTIMRRQKCTSINKLGTAKNSRELQECRASGDPPHRLKKRPLFTRISSNKVPWSTLRNSWSQTGMSSVLFSLFSSSSGGGGSSLWWVHH